MRKAFIILIVLLLISLYAQPTLAKTTFDFSFKSRNITVGDARAREFADYMSNEYISPFLYRVAHEDLMEDVLATITRSLSFKVIDLLWEDADGNGVSDIIDMELAIVKGELQDPNRNYIDNIIDALIPVLKNNIDNIYNVYTGSQIGRAHV